MVEARRGYDGGGPIDGHSRHRRAGPEQVPVPAGKLDAVLPGPLDTLPAERPRRSGERAFGLERDRRGLFTRPHGVFGRGRHRRGWQARARPGQPGDQDDGGGRRQAREHPGRGPGQDLAITLARYRGVEVGGLPGEHPEAPEDRCALRAARHMVEDPLFVRRRQLAERHRFPGRLVGMVGARPCRRLGVQLPDQPVVLSHRCPAASARCASPAFPVRSGSGPFRRATTACP